MTDRSQNRKAILTGPFVPVPVSPFYSIFNTAQMSTKTYKRWDWYIPSDDMVYTICNFTVVAAPAAWIHAAVMFNDSYVFREEDNFQVRWSPGVTSGPKLAEGLKVSVLVECKYTTLHNYYWQMDFYRDPLKVR